MMKISTWKIIWELHTKNIFYGNKLREENLINLKIDLLIIEKKAFEILMFFIENFKSLNLNKNNLKRWLNLWNP